MSFLGSSSSTYTPGPGDIAREEANKAKDREIAVTNAETTASNDTIKNNYRKSRSSNMLFKSSGEAGVSRKTLLGG